MCYLTKQSNLRSKSYIYDSNHVLETENHIKTNTTF